jgi:hypothetical protein
MAPSLRRALHGHGFDWFTVLDAIALPGRPESGFFDPLSDPTD